MKKIILSLLILSLIGFASAQKTSKTISWYDTTTTNNTLTVHRHTALEVGSYPLLYSKSSEEIFPRTMLIEAIKNQHPLISQEVDFSITDFLSISLTRKQYNFNYQKGIWEPAKIIDSKKSYDFGIIVLILLVLQVIIYFFLAPKLKSSLPFIVGLMGGLVTEITVFKVKDHIINSLSFPIIPTEEHFKAYTFIGITGILICIAGPLIAYLFFQLIKKIKGAPPIKKEPHEGFGLESEF
ncbi:MAG: hypothetical protein WC059_02365 [Candidatus Paceibacterota bacterium]